MTESEVPYVVVLIITIFINVVILRYSYVKQRVNVSQMAMGVSLVFLFVICFPRISPSTWLMTILLASGCSMVIVFTGWLERLAQWFGRVVGRVVAPGSEA